MLLLRLTYAVEETLEKPLECVEAGVDVLSVEVLLQFRQ